MSRQPFPPPPRVKWSLRVPADVIMSIPCRACRAQAGRPCMFARMAFTLLPLYVQDAPHVHTRRYQDAITVTELAAISDAGQP